MPLPELGARPRGGGQTEFRVWAPRAREVSLEAGGERLAMEHAGASVYEAVAEAPVGTDYRYVLDGRACPDPCSRWQPAGLRGPSRVYQATKPGAFQPPALKDLVICELHVGTFSSEGTFAGAIPHLRELAELGITAIELMPVAEFPGARGWGYDGVYLSAAQSSYGGPAGLQELIEAAHGVGLAVILDVVYNHVGASGTKALEAFGPYFTDRYETPWGRAINFDGAGREGVREWVCQSAEGWVRDFGLDGLRLDAIHAIFDSSAEHIVAEVARRVHAIDRRAIVIGEIGLEDRHAHGGDACDAVWDDHLHHALHVLLTGEREGYYESFGRLEQLAAALASSGPSVVYAQNHDQVGNRALGDRMALDVLPLAALVTLLSPFTPLLFMGEEYGEPAPFQFFSDHIDKRIAEATRRGRREEFASFAGFADPGQVPDPQSEDTFLRSKLTREREAAVADLYFRLLSLRRELGPVAVTGIAFDERERWLRFARGSCEVVCNFAAAEVSLPVDGERLVLATEGSAAGLRAGLLRLPARSGAVVA